MHYLWWLHVRPQRSASTGARRRLSTVSNSEVMEILSPRRSKREKRLVFSNFKPSEMKKQVYSSAQHVFVATDSEVCSTLCVFVL